ncbi:amino acid ABC transporter permease [Paracoccus lutimaris]|uniref:L-glutamine ABC transporter membrane protein /L-glutamate ABC transporter membrane protein /L-aspartate ABC transporter membrane protein /L-asparagine ABC transporter membrane protein n=1 Tax=Paracoccus lutimaris TaxID=1490030 RepID=A0A368YZM3_9RHOB|nr:amino acid ABC transporter permease [Paracoccus lutimaris]RCW85119.1 L-glutamine ABC transporter membrane protein /L-glutamate ABC transporter membrane protein /L-aspartate ABC transporter membrane protein /L-asparagine ABC transporter membrane protein [Paracoccus lutimaris]
MSDIQAQSPAFVRETMLPPQPPPSSAAGVVLWLRTNLFSGPLNIALTVLGLAIIWMIFRTLWPWLSHSVWNAGSMAECRQIISEAYGPDAHGGCFAIIKHRWNQFVFGFYPQDLYWRPVLAFGLLFLALAPVLFADSAKARRIVLGLAVGLTLIFSAMLGGGAGALVGMAVLMLGWVALIETRPGWALLASLLYPFLAVWLLWGGSLWGPVMALAGFGVGFAVWQAGARYGLFAVALGAVAAALWWMFAAAPVAHTLAGLVPLRLTPVSSDQFGGFVLSITIGVAGIALSLPMGIILALARRSDLPVIKMMAVMFIEFIRGVPLITLLFVASLLLNYFLPPGTNFDIILRVIIMVTLFSSAYMAEVIRGGLAALPKGQYEAADALGLDYWKAQRLIILPQALKVSIPGIVSTFIGMFKDTTLVVFVGLFDPLKAMSDTVRASFEWKGAYWEPYIFVGSIFFILCFGMSRYSMYLERRLKRDHR